MKTYLRRLGGKIVFWNLFIGLVIGFALGVIFINALIPNANQLILMYRLDKESRAEDNAARKDGLEREIEIKGN